MWQRVWAAVQGLVATPAPEHGPGGDAGGSDRRRRGGPPAGAGNSRRTQATPAHLPDEIMSEPYPEEVEERAAAA